MPVHAPVPVRAFGAPVSELTVEELCEPDLVYQIGVVPRRIDILTSLTGLAFSEAWQSRVDGKFGPLSCAVLGRDQLIRNRRLLGRPRDLADLESLGE